MVMKQCNVTALVSDIFMKTRESNPYHGNIPNIIMEFASCFVDQLRSVASNATIILKQLETWAIRPYHTLPVLLCPINYTTSPDGALSLMLWIFCFHVPWSKTLKWYDRYIFSASCIECACNLSQYHFYTNKSSYTPLVTINKHPWLATVLVYTWHCRL